MSNKRDNFQWRPNDNSSVTRIRYDLEVNQWLKSIGKSSVNSKSNMGHDFAFIGLIFSTMFFLILFIITCLSDFISWIISGIRKNKKEKYIKQELKKPRKFPILDVNKHTIDDFDKRCREEGDEVFIGEDF